MPKTAVVIGAGPAGLTAAYELLTRTDVVPIIFEKTDKIGGISQTAEYKGNRFDIGGHRFFSKSDAVMEWWNQFMGICSCEGQNTSCKYCKPDDNPEKPRFSLRSRVSRILFLGKLFDYPLSLHFSLLANLGFVRAGKVGLSYLKTMVLPKREENSLEDFFINRFGYELYDTFFKDYTEKVWGLPCSEISPEWGEQRVKGLSILSVLSHAIKSALPGKEKSIGQKETETSLIERFLYPQLGPGEFWELVASEIEAKGSKIEFNREVVGFIEEGGNITQVVIQDELGEKTTLSTDYVFSSMPIKQLFNGLQTQSSQAQKAKNTAAGLVYRDFLTVGLVLKNLHLPDSHGKTSLPPDNWIYIQEKDMKVGRLQIFNNWSPALVADPGTVLVGLEYFCNEGDELWTMPDLDLERLAASELAQIRMINKEDVIDSTVVRMPKAYPAYFGSYDSFDILKEYIDRISNLFPIGRNGMHRYNNMDHSMLSAMVSVDCICDPLLDKSSVWEINAETEYHEAK